MPPANCPFSAVSILVPGSSGAPGEATKACERFDVQNWTRLTDNIIVTELPRSGVLGDEGSALAQTHAKTELAGSSSLISKLLDSFPGPAVILNQDREIVLANDKLAAFLGKSQQQLQGLRPGEALNCVHWKEGVCGCGTTKFCVVCGADQAIRNSQRNHASDVQECQLTVCREEGEISLDLRVWTTPLEEAGPFTVFALQDISHEKRRAVLERAFFHDVLNTVSGLHGLMQICSEETGEEGQRACQLATNAVNELLEELRCGRDLAAAEHGELATQLQDVDAEKLLTGVCDLYRHSAATGGKRLVVQRLAGPAVVRTDRTLMQRVLGNLVKNALEASGPGETVSVGFKDAGVPTFWVHNESTMPNEVQPRIFHRSFTTKPGTGRGLGLYSVKLLVERYLGGSVSFRSVPNAGTTFLVTLPG